MFILKTHSKQGNYISVPPRAGNTRTGRRPFVSQHFLLIEIAVRIAVAVIKAVIAAGRIIIVGISGRSQDLPAAAAAAGSGRRSCHIGTALAGIAAGTAAAVAAGIAAAPVSGIPAAYAAVVIVPAAASSAAAAVGVPVIVGCSAAHTAVIVVPAGPAENAALLDAAIICVPVSRGPAAHAAVIIISTAAASTLSASASVTSKTTHI